MIIQHNLSALRIYNSLTQTHHQSNRIMEKLASGLAINRGADNAAGLAISEKMRGQIFGLSQAGRNAQDGVSLLQTAEGGLTEIHSVLQRMRELSVQAANDTNTMTDRAFIQQEIDDLRQEINRLSNSTQFNGKTLLDGTSSALTSSDKLSTRLFVNGSVRSTDAFGQPVSIEGNYKVTIETTPGLAQIQKSAMFKLKHASAASSGGLGSPLTSVEDVSLSSYSPALATGQVNAAGTAIGALPADTTRLYDIDRFWDASGNFILSKAKTVTVVQGDGKRASFVLDGADTIATLRDKLNSAVANGLGQAAAIGVTAPANLVVYLDPDAAPPGSSTSTPSIPSVPWTSLNPIEKVIYGLTKGWLEVSEKRIQQYYGLLGSGLSMSVRIYDKAAYGVLGAVSSSYYLDLSPGGGRAFNHQLWLDLADFQPGTMPDGANALPPQFYDDRIIAHEMTHAVMSVNMNWDQVSTWFKEGAAELIHGRDSQLKTDLEAAGAPGNVNGAASAVLATLNGAWGGSNANYSAAYAGLRYLNQRAVALGHTVKDIMQDLQSNTLDHALSTYAGYANEAAFLSDLTSGGGVAFVAGLYSGGTLANTDTGAIGGADVSGGAVLTDSSVIDESLATDLTDGQPLSGWNIIWPTNTTTPSANPTFDPLTAAAYTYTPGLTTGLTGTGASTVPGTIVIRSALAGSMGDLSFVGDDDLLAALGFNTIQKSLDNRYAVTVTNAHTGATVLAEESYGSNRLNGKLHENIDLEFDFLSGIHTTWDTANNQWLFQGGAAYQSTTFVHLADRSLTLQVGANSRQELVMGMGRFDTAALGLENVLVLTNELANNAIGAIDKAIARVSGQRAQIGAWQNKLEHTRNNLANAAENLTAAESRIRDTDMAKEMMNWVKCNIINQAGALLLPQASRAPQTVLQLLR